MYIYNSSNVYIYNPYIPSIIYIKKILLLYIKEILYINI